MTELSDSEQVLEERKMVYGYLISGNSLWDLLENVLESDDIVELLGDIEAEHDADTKKMFTEIGQRIYENQNSILEG